MMVITAQDLKTAEIACPILVGGAALSNRFTRIKIAPEYGGTGRIRQRCDERARPRESDHGSRGAQVTHHSPRRGDAAAAGERIESRRCAVEAGGARQRAPRHRDSASARSEAARAARLRPRRNFRLHQSEVAVCETSRLQEFRRGARERRCEGARAERRGRGSRASDDRARRHQRQRDLQILPGADRRRSHA